MLRAARSDALVELQGQELAWGPIRTRSEVVELDPDEANQARLDIDRFLLTESQVLLHHASETLMILFFAHEGSPPCPWLEMASLRTRDVNESLGRVLDTAWEPEFESVVNEVFFGADPGNHSPELAASRAATVRLLRIVARKLLADSRMYNAAKHGLACVAGHASVHFSDEGGGEAALGADGTLMEYLEWEGSRATGVTWLQTSQWLNPQQAAWTTTLILTQMDALWAVARRRYLGEEVRGFEIVTEEAVEYAVTGFPLNGPLRSMKFEVAYVPGEDEGAG